MASHSSSGVLLAVEIDDFALIDYFPGRSHFNKLPSIATAVEKVLVERHTDRVLIARLGLPETGEAIVCIFTGKMNGRPVKVGAFAKYETPLTAVFVRNSASFKRAVDEAIASVAAQATQEVMAPSPP